MKLLTLCGVKQHHSFWFWNPSFVLHQALIRELIKPFRQNSSLEDVVQRLQQLHLDFGSTKARSVPSVPEASPHRSVPTQLMRSHSNETASIPAHNTEAFTLSRESLTSHPALQVGAFSGHQIMCADRREMDAFQSTVEFGPQKKKNKQSETGGL